MKKLVYKIYALIFNICQKLFKIKNDRVCFVSMHNENFNDCLGGVYKYLKVKSKYEFVFITREDLKVSPKNILKLLSFFFVKSRLLATSKYVFLNDNFLPMGMLNFDKEAFICQLWHGEGIFKKFGLDIAQDNFTRDMERKANERLSIAVCTSKNVVPHYATAFGLPESKVIPLGSARVDYFYNKRNKKSALSKLHELYPETVGKKVVLYAPTFRDDADKNAALMQNFNFEKFQAKLGKQYTLLVRLHPQVPTKMTQLHGAINATDYDDVRELVLSCDILITDYSSISMDFALMNKKIIYFAFDLEDYIKDRDFYLPYEDFVSGEIARTTDEVITHVKCKMDMAKNDKFKKFNFDYDDGNNAQRIVEYVFNKENNNFNS